MFLPDLTEEWRVLQWCSVSHDVSLLESLVTVIIGYNVCMKDCSRAAAAHSNKDFLSLWPSSKI